MSPNSSQRFFADHYPHSAVLTPLILALCTPLFCDLFPEITSYFFFFPPKQFLFISPNQSQSSSFSSSSSQIIGNEMLSSYTPRMEQLHAAVSLSHEVLVDLKVPLPTGNDRPGVWKVPFTHLPPHADSLEGWYTSKSSAPNSLLNFRIKSHSFLPFAGIF